MSGRASLRIKGAALGNLGDAYRLLGQHREAIQHHEQALAIHRETGDRQGEESGRGIGKDRQSAGEAIEQGGMRRRRAKSCYERNHS